jgi:hypothetical protein
VSIVSCAWLRVAVRSITRGRVPQACVQRAQHVCDFCPHGARGRVLSDSSCAVLMSRLCLPAPALPACLPACCACCCSLSALQRSLRNMLVPETHSCAACLAAAATQQHTSEAEEGGRLGTSSASCSLSLGAYHHARVCQKWLEHCVRRRRPVACDSMAGQHVNGLLGCVWCLMGL